MTRVHRPHLSRKIIWEKKIPLPISVQLLFIIMMLEIVTTNFILTTVPTRASLTRSQTVSPSPSGSGKKLRESYRPLMLLLEQLYKLIKWNALIFERTQNANIQGWRKTLSTRPSQSRSSELQSTEQRRSDRTSCRSHPTNIGRKRLDHPRQGYRRKW